jgi:hypothetical protein
MPTPFPTAPIARNQPRDGTTSLIHGFRLRNASSTGNATSFKQMCRVQPAGRAGGLGWTWSSAKFAKAARAKGNTKVGRAAKSTAKPKRKARKGK